MSWNMLHEMFGGSISDIRKFKQSFKESLKAAKLAYPDAIISDDDGGIMFHASPPPIKKTKIAVSKVVD